MKEKSMKNNKHIIKFLVSFCTIITILILNTPLSVFAEGSTSVIMTYKGTTYTKVLYDVETEMIKNGSITNGLKNIEEMCDNVEVLSGGSAVIDKPAVISTIRDYITAGKTSINIDLSYFIKGTTESNAAIVAQYVSSLPAEQTDAENAAATAETALITDGTLPTTTTATSPAPAAVAPPVKPAAYSAAMNNYYKKAVFIGDSIMVGFRNYSMKAKDSYLNHANFLCAGSYSLRNALRQASDLHPTYKGAKRPVWESIGMMDVDRVFIMFGMNDISVVGVDKSVDNFASLISKIKTVKPNIEINIISMTNVLAGNEGKGLNNASVRDFNTKLEAACLKNGWGFCNLAPYMVDANGALAKEYCSDGFVHQTHKAYSEVWEPFFYNYAVLRGVN